MIEYKNIESLSFSEIEFNPVETNNIGAVSRDETDFISGLRTILDLTKQEEFYLGILVFPANNPTRRFLAFNFLENRQIATYELRSSDNFDAWINTLTEGYSAERGLYFDFSRRSSSSGSVNVSSFIGSPGSFLKSQVPRHYRSEEFQMERDEFLNQYVVMESMKQDIDLPETSLLWQNLLNTSGGAKVGATSEQAKEFESATGFPLPPELVTVYATSNGANNIINGYDLLSLDQVIEHWKFWKEIFDSWTLTDLTSNNWSQDGLTIGIYTNPRWIPIIEKFQAHFIGMDLMPGPNGKVGQIIHFGRDQDLIVREAENLNEFLKARATEVV